MTTDNIVEWLPAAVEATCKAIQEEIEEEERRQLQRILATHGNPVLPNAKRKRTETTTMDTNASVTVQNQPSLPSGGNALKNAQSQCTVTHRSSQSSAKNVVSAPATQLTAPKRTSQSKARIGPLPKYEFCVPITSSFLVPDEPELAFVPLIAKRGDEPLSRNSVLSMHQTSYRERLIEYGAECQQEQVNRRLDAIFCRLFSIRSDDHQGDVRIPPPDHKVWGRIANGTCEPRSRVLDRFRDWLTTHVALPVVESEDDDEEEEEGESSPDLRLAEVERESTEESHDPKTLDALYEKEMDSYRKLWCRQCYIYDCNLHGLANKPSVAVQIQVAKLKERDGFWKEPLDGTLTVYPNKTMTYSKLSGVRLAMCKVLHDIFDGDVQCIAFLLRVPVAAVEEYLERQRHAGLLEPYKPLEDPTARFKKKSLNPYSVKHYRPEWYKRYRDSKIFPWFYPCLHDAPCSDFTNCTCIQNRFFCTPACAWNRRSPNFFRGCDCKGNCTTTCTCFLAKRECDPNLCKCTVATDPPHQLISRQRCRNDNMIMHRSPPLLIGVSSVAGWGVFARFPLQTGDFIGKYVGEVMSQEEAERRGLIADEKGCSYLFLMASDVSVDACRKGSKVRFINHSSTPNVKPQSTYGCADASFRNFISFVFL
jgi:SET domain